VNTSELKGGQILTHCSSAFEPQRTFVAFHLALPNSQKLLNSVKKSGRCGLFGVKGSVFGDG